MAYVLLNASNRAPSELSGLSTDVKPTDVDYDSTFYEEDTGIMYMYGSSGWVVDNRNLGGMGR